MTDADPHAGQGMVSAGAPRGASRAALVALHGRGATAQGVVNLTQPLHRHGLTVVAPEAARSRWFPYAASEPVERNEPHLSSALDAVDRTIATVREWGIPPECVVLFGFSQGATLAGAYAVRHPRRFGGLALLSGGLPEDPSESEGDGDLAGTPTLVSYGADDPHLDDERASATASVLRNLGGDVTVRREDGVGHEVTDAAFEAVGDLVDTCLAE